MREVIAVCRSSKRSRVRVAAVLDRYFWRIGDRTWRGRASNACLDRVARELRVEAKRNTAVVIHEIRSARESRVPIVRIGSRLAFSPEGVAPISVHAAGAGRLQRSQSERARIAIVKIAVLFHDLGKATKLFQGKLRRGLNPNAKPEADAVRHELFSAAVWDELAGHLNDKELIERLRTVTPQEISDACAAVIPRLQRFHAAPSKPMGFAFTSSNDGTVAREETIAHAIGMLVLTHHRLPAGSSNHLELLAERHVNAGVILDLNDLQIAEGPPHWRSERWVSRLRRSADDLNDGGGAPGLDIQLRASLMFADHLGSALSEARETFDGHLGNTTKDRKNPADPLDVHIDRVWQRALGCYDMLHRHRERYPALCEDQVPIDIRHPEPAGEPFGWQAIASNAAKNLCEGREGGFFACLMAGTGTGKTRGAPTILAAAAFSDAIPERRYLRMTLALGLRSLATQSADEYVKDLRFDPDDVAVLIGQPPVRFNDEKEPEISDGSESRVVLPDWLRVERVRGSVPNEGEEREADWLRRLSVDTDRGLPATLDLIFEKAGNVSPSVRLLATSPIIVGTVDQLMGVASPLNSRYLVQALRVLSSDLILDEIDQYDPEDIAAIGRLIYQTAAGGRRVIIMSATLTQDVARALHLAYREGWRAYAAASGRADHVNLLCSGDAAGSWATNAEGHAFEQIYDACRNKTVEVLSTRPPQRRGRLLPACASWNDLVQQVDAECVSLHEGTAQQVNDIKVSVGFVRMTRISHTAALAVQLPAGPRDGRLRLKLCLHSQFPRLHRAWIESELKKALTRKGHAPNAELRTFCERHNLFKRVDDHGCTELEIVVVTSPVIETGNDLDFDWAILDPSSMRTIVQAAGRVWRHRAYLGTAPNVSILGQCAIVMQTEKLARPGVETWPHRDTGVPRIDLEAFGKRLVTDLVGAETFNTIDASALLCEVSIPLREKEAELRLQMLNIESDSPLGCYIRHSTARLNRRMTQSRMFRRSTTRDLLYFQDGADPHHAEWQVDFAPGTRNSLPRRAQKHGLQFFDADEPFLLFPTLSARSWEGYLRSGDGPTLSEVHDLSKVIMQDYGDPAIEPEPAVTYGTWTGFTRGKPEDLSQPFGKNVREHDVAD